jgi:putative transposase
MLRGEVAERARDLIRQICQAREVSIIRGAISPDHIRMLVASEPSELVYFKVYGPILILELH